MPSRRRPLGQDLLDLRLSIPQPAHGPGEIFRLDGVEAEFLAEGRVRALGQEHASGGEPGVGVEHAGDEEGDGAVALRAAPRGEDPLETELAERAEHGSDMAVRTAAFDGEGVVGGEESIASQ